MKRNGIAVIGLVLVAGLGGCFPEKRVVWSPDGTRAAVIGADGLYLCGEDGVLSPRVAEEVRHAAWMPDSRRLLLARVEKVKSWKEVLGFLTDDQRTRVQSIGEMVRVEALAYQGDMDKFDSEYLAVLTDGEKGAVLLYIRDERSEGLPEKLGDKWKQAQDMEIDGWSLQVAEVRPSGAQLGAVITRSVDEIQGLCVSPDGGAVAFVQPMAAVAGSDNLRLLAMPADGSASPRLVAERVGWSADWSADGRQLAYAYSRSGDGDKLRLGTVARRTVRDGSGQFLAEFAAPEDQVGTLVENEVAVRCLKDGRILFSGIEVQLPCTEDDMPQHTALFCVHPGVQPGVLRVTSRGSQAQAADWMYFEVSPDGQHVCHAGGNGQVSILSLTTGKSWTVVDEKAAGGKLLMVPVWRTSDEICCALAGAEGASRGVVALCKLDWAKHAATRKVISANWPDAAVKDFLEPETRPAAETQPVEK